MMLSRYRRTITTITLPETTENRHSYPSVRADQPAECSKVQSTSESQGSKWREVYFKLDPDALRTPIAAALVLAPPVLIVGSPLPIIGVDLNASIGGVGISLFGAPAVACTIADLVALSENPAVNATAVTRFFLLSPLT
jgi:hypothetical protein